MQKLKLSHIPDYIAGNYIADIQQKYNLRKVIKLASNENPYGPPRYIIRKIKKNLKNILRYPDKEYKVLKSKIAVKIGLSPDNIILGNGTDEIIDSIFKIKIKPGSKVIIFNPTFSLYKILAIIYSAKMIEIELGNNFEFNIEKIIKKLDDSIDLMIICNPNNPTGTYINANNLVRIIEKLSKRTLLFIDEAYANYSTAPDFPDTVKLFKNYENKKNILVTRTFSKIYSLAGLRIGYGFGNKNLISIMNKIRMPFNVNLIADIAAFASLENDKFIENCKLKNFETKKFVYNELAKLGVDYIKSEANFILLRLSRKAQFVYEKLLQKGIIVRPIDDKHIRLTIGTKKEVKKFLRELRKILK